jgi:ADP-heptose:LPS heptosyltransferase
MNAGHGSVEASRTVSIASAERCAARAPSPAGAAVVIGSTGAATVVVAQSRDFLGAVLLHMPLLWALRRRDPPGRVIVYARCPRARLLGEVGLADDVRLFRSVTPELVREIRGLRPGLIVNLHPSSVPLHVATALSGAPLRAGFRTLTGRFACTHPVEHDRGIYRGLLYLRAAEALAVPADLADVFHHLAATHRAEGSGRARTRICLLPGGGAGAFKRWGIANYLELCHALRPDAPGAEFVFCVGRDDDDSLRGLASADAPAGTRVVVGAPIPELCAEILGSSVVVGNDCGPAHIALMGGARFVGLYSNADGRVGERLAEWFLPSVNTRALAAEAGRDIRSIPVATVVAAARALMSATDALPIVAAAAR